MTARQVVVVTGAGAGVGRAIVRAFAARGADVGLLARGQERLEAAAKEVEAAGGRACVLAVDVADSEAVEAAAARVENELGPIDVWVNNAMTSVFGEFMEVSDDEFRRVTDVTYHGYVYGTRAALARMLPRDRGVVVQVGSALAYRGIPLQAAYCGAKHAIQGFTESLRCELLHHGSAVQVGMVQLPAVNTPQFDWVLSRLPRRAQPVPPIYQPELIAEAVVRFAEQPRREMWLGWPTIRAILANRVAPGLLDWYLGQKGVDSQQTDEPESDDRPSNLWSPVGGHWAAHGRFDDKANDSSPAIWASRHRRGVTAVTALAATVAAGVTARRR
ncbi:MAG: SDR family oxidoreductase [Actinobacteria bacterium]|nr:SDR family oxidoreductase [Actinomycetota bacterium]